MLKSTIFEIDLAKTVIQVYQISSMVNESRINREPTKMKRITSKGSAIYYCSWRLWKQPLLGRCAEQFGHVVRIIIPKKVKGFLEGHKTVADNALDIANTSLQKLT